MNTSELLHKRQPKSPIGPTVTKHDTIVGGTLAAKFNGYNSF